tara:strand:+ start:113 stop:352 length:240 start_codon:yes stop_codon:yes gene_type:complete
VKKKPHYLLLTGSLSTVAALETNDAPKLFAGIFSLLVALGITSVAITLCCHSRFFTDSAEDRARESGTREPLVLSPATG